jgi:hypothetical protein
MYSLFIHVNVLIAELKYNFDAYPEHARLCFWLEPYLLNTPPPPMFTYRHRAVAVITVAKSMFIIWGNFFVPCKISVNCSILFAVF